MEYRSWHRLRAVGNNLEPALDKALGGNTHYFLGERDGPGFGCAVLQFTTGLDWQFCPSITLRAGYIYSMPDQEKSNSDQYPYIGDN